MEDKGTVARMREGKGEVRARTGRYTRERRVTQGTERVNSNAEGYAK